MNNEKPLIPENPSSPALLPSERGEGSRKPSLPSETGEGVGSEGRAIGAEDEAWREALPAIADRLREIGYDIASSQSGAPLWDSIVARRDLGDRAVVLAIDAGGRFRAEISWVVGEWPSRDEIAGMPVQVIDAVSRTVSVTGELSGPEQVVAAVRDLGAIASWAGVAESEALPQGPEA
jgi:hypothetical protein